ncbi:retrovirus-related pol polyprotein from transposon TNT 1-94 [Tanacetum coccineum]
MNGQSFTLDFNTFRSSTGIDYNKGKYVAHPTPEVVKTELGKIATNPSYLDKTPVLKNSFPVAWRILFTFVIQVLGGNYSSTKHINSIQQMIAYCIITGTEVDIGEIIYSNLVTKLLSKSRLKYVTYPRKKKKVKSETVTSTLPQLQGPEASGTLPQKRKKPKSKKPPTKTKVTPPPIQQRVFEQSHSVSSGTVPDPQDPERNIQLAGTRLPSTLDEGARKSQPLPECTTTDPKDSGGKIQPADKGLPSMVSDEGVAKTTPFPKGARMDLFGPTFVSSLMNKKYCLVVTDDYSRFTWVFFLVTKDETSGILKIFITEFYEEKGIKKEFSAARTSQQNDVAERRNRTLIEAANLW